MFLKQILKKLRKNIKSRFQSRIKADLKHNNVIIPRGCTFRLEIKGRNNTVILPEKIHPDSTLNINIHGNNNVIRIDSAEFLKLKIKIGDSNSFSHNCTVSIGEKTSCWDTIIFLYEHNSSVTICRDCMIT